MKGKKLNKNKKKVGQEPYKRFSSRPSLFIWWIFTGSGTDTKLHNSEMHVTTKRT